VLTCCLQSYSGSHPAEDSSRPRPTGLNSPHHYSYTSLRPVVNYVPRPHLHQLIKEQLHDERPDVTDTRILAVQGLDGSGKSQLVLNYVREYREDYSTIFWVEAGQKELIERDYLQIHRLLFGPTSVTGARRVERRRRGGGGEEVVSWSDGVVVGGVRQCGRPGRRRRRIIP
jgi:hypothetical protein